MIISASYCRFLAHSNCIGTLSYHRIAPFYIMPLTECKNSTRNSFYGSLNSPNWVKEFFLLSSNFSVPPTFTDVPMLRSFQKLIAYSLNQYLDTFFLVFRIFPSTCILFEFKILEKSFTYLVPPFSTMFRTCSAKGVGSEMFARRP